MKPHIYVFFFWGCLACLRSNSYCINCLSFYFAGSLVMIFLWHVRYGLIWISTTLVFMLASFGNCATYLMQKYTNSSASWSFDVSFVNVAACTVYGYAIVVPLAYYFLLQYMGSSASLVRFWCLWGYSLFIFVITSVSFCLFCWKGFLSKRKKNILTVSSFLSTDARLCEHYSSWW